MRSQMGNVTSCEECRGTGIARSRLRSVPDDPSALGEEWYSLADDLCPRCDGEGRRVRKKSLADQFNLPLLSR
jgi:DnaJ-class molecular chaperone